MHTQSKLHNNSILTGSVDSYCLVCDNYLRSEDEAFAHIEKPIHKKNMGVDKRVEKFMDDWIIKVKKGYYCRFCNVLLTTTTKVTIHIADTIHLENKGAKMLTRVGDNIIAFDEVAITLESWHGLTDNTCVICNTEFEDNMHRNDQGHVLKLVQSKCEFGDKYIYRKVDEDTFFCLICASIFSINEKLNHHENANHKNLYNSGKKLKYKIPPSIQQTKLTPKLDPVKTSNTHAIKSIDNIDTKTAEKAEVKIDKVEKIKLDIKSTQNNARELIIPADGRMKIELSQEKELTTLLENSAHGCNVKEKPSTMGNEKAVKGSVDEEKQTDILDRVDEFQRKGMNIDFTWEKARCKHCGENVAFNTAAIERHINGGHNIKMKTHSVEPRIESQKQKKSDNNNDIKPVVKKVETKTEKNKINHTVEAKTKIDNKVGPNQDLKKSENIIEQKQDTKKQHITSENSINVKTNTKKTENVVEPKTTKKQRKMSENVNATDTNTKKIGNLIESTLDLMNQKKSDNETKPYITKELEKLAKENNMIVMPNKAYCPQCKVETPLNAAAIKAHTILNSHKERNINQKDILGKKERVQAECIQTFIQMESNLGSDIILNNKYVLRHHSFHCIILDDDNYTCMLCDVYFRKTGELTVHMNGPDHKNKLGLCKVISSMSEEYIREITPDVYHCGYCNVVFESWTELQDHLSHSMHLYARRHSQWNLERCQSVIRNTKLMQISSMHAINFA